MQTPHINIVGAGLAGALLAVMLAHRGFSVTIYERRGDPRCTRAESGRSINLALAARGIRALEYAGVMEHVRPLMIPMRGRMVHEPSSAPALLPYGQREHEVIYSVGRGALNRVLIEEAARHDNVTLRFDQTCLSVDPAHDVMRFKDADSGRTYEARLTPTIATDGAGSAVRTSLAEAGDLTVRDDLLDHDYKELTIPPVKGRWALEPNALHIWPRGGFMLIALPNTDGSFTATLFLKRGDPGPQASGTDNAMAQAAAPARAGIVTPGAVASTESMGSSDWSFAKLTSPAAIMQFFDSEFPDARALMPNLVAEFLEHPQGRLGTIHTTPWRVDGKVLLLGDAAHAIVPFHGQGMNAAFEDCLVFDELLNNHTTWSRIFESFEVHRRPNAAAIAQMALENYDEMRDHVLDDRFLRQKAKALELERLAPDRFIPRYAMVMFHPEISYSEAFHRGKIQQEILDLLDQDADSGRALALIRERLPAIALTPARV